MSTLESLHRGSGDYRIVWEILYAYDAYQRHAHDGIEWQTKSREQSITHIIAPTLDMAKAAFALRCSSYELVTATPLCTINYEIGVGGERYL